MDIPITIQCKECDRELTIDRAEWRPLTQKFEVFVVPCPHCIMEAKKDLARCIDSVIKETDQ